MSENRGIDKLMRSHLVNLGGYAASTSPDTLEGKVEVPVGDIIKLDANENPYGCSPRVNEALARCASINIYPDSGQNEFRKLLAGYTGVGSEHIVGSAGGDQLIDLIMRLLVAPGDEVISCVPTFAMFRFFIDLWDGVPVEIPRDGSFAVNVNDVKTAITARTKLILLATPNNPTGTVTPREDIIRLLDTGVPVLVDEAYYEFVGETVVPLVKEYDNLMVLRTFSKWAGLAGLRVGYGLFPAKVADYLLKIKEPYCINAAALVAVRESFKDMDYLMERVKDIITERERLLNELKKLTWLESFPSLANFILCRVLNGKARELYQALQKKGILVRYFAVPRLSDCIRISVGKPEHTDALLKVLREMGGG